MCFIIIKPREVSLSSSEKVQRVLAKRTINADGVGYAVCNGNEVVWRKGLNIANEEVERLLMEPATVVVHFRAASSGPVEDEMCHPFLISSARSIFLKKGKLRRGEALLFHNGVLPNGHTVDKLNISDTAFTAAALSTLVRLRPSVIKGDWAMVRGFLSAHLTQRFALVVPGMVYLTGQWERWEGCWVSSPVEYFPPLYGPYKGGKGYYGKEKHWGLF